MVGSRIEAVQKLEKALANPDNSASTDHRIQEAIKLIEEDISAERVRVVESSEVEI